MPSIIPDWIYALFGSIIISTIVISACVLTTTNVKQEAEQQQLANIARYVATKSMEAISSTSANNLTITLVLDLPPLIGNQRYWIQINNDSSSAWVEVGFGATVLSSNERASIPADVYASGTYVSDSPAAFLSCCSENSIVYLSLSGGD